MRSGIHFLCGRIRRGAPRGPAQIPASILPFASPAGCGSALSLGGQPAGIIRTKLADRPSGKCRPALSHSKVQLPCFDDLPNCSAPRARIAPLFSHTYKSLFPQTLSFDILTKRRGGYTPHGICRCRAGLNRFCFILLRALLYAFKIQLSCFQLFARSFTETPGWGCPSSRKNPENGCGPALSLGGQPAAQFMLPSRPELIKLSRSAVPSVGEW